MKDKREINRRDTNAVKNNNLGFFITNGIIFITITTRPITKLAFVIL